MPRNLMVSDNPADPRLGVLDFQDAVYGPVTYDIASLLRDAFISWDEEFVLEVTIRYWERARRLGLLDHEGFYRPMLDWLAQVTGHGFMREAQNVLITVGTEPSTLLPALVQAAGLAPAPHPERL